ncbi:MAG TPA: NAD(P)-binding domain-containing protein [Actinomycetota bacterium]|nr:NAD(P)-binding domain-containing protein [Actinomycetota bacterium]
MARIFHDEDAAADALAGKSVAVVGYGNQGRAWAQNLRDSGVHVRVGTVADTSRAEAEADAFSAREIPDAVAGADVVCLLIPDEVMGDAVASLIAPSLRDGAALCFASGYAVAFDEVKLPDTIDAVLVAPRMIGVGVRDSYVDGSGFIAFVGVEQDPTGNAWQVALGIARALGALRRGSVEMTFKQEALIDLFVEQAIAPGLRKLWSDAAMVLLEAGIPLEAILAEFYLSGEIERTYRAMREIGPTKQWRLHSQTSQYGTMSRAQRFAALDLATPMRAAVEEIGSGAFAREWAGVRADGYKKMKELYEAEGRDALMDFEDDVRSKFEPTS